MLLKSGDKNAEKSINSTSNLKSVEIPVFKNVENFFHFNKNHRKYLLIISQLRHKSVEIPANLVVFKEKKLEETLEKRRNTC